MYNSIEFFRAVKGKNQLLLRFNNYVQKIFDKIKTILFDVLNKLFVRQNNYCKKCLFKFHMLL